MEDKEELLKTETAGEVITSTCSLWYHISVISLVFFIIGILESDNLLEIVASLTVMLICQSYTLRLNLDEKLFRVLYKNLDTKAFDNSLQVLFNKKQTETRPLMSRWLGTKTLLQNSVLWLIIQAMLLVYIIID